MIPWSRLRWYRDRKRTRKVRRTTSLCTDVLTDSTQVSRRKESRCQVRTLVLPLNHKPNPTASTQLLRSGSSSHSPGLLLCSGASFFGSSRLYVYSPGACSPLTANIYFPAIPTISAAFHKSTELINLTVTVYMIVQGICASSRLLSKTHVLTHWWL